MKDGSPSFIANVNKHSMAWEYLLWIQRNPVKREVENLRRERPQIFSKFAVINVKLNVEVFWQVLTMSRSATTIKENSCLERTTHHLSLNQWSQNTKIAFCSAKKRTQYLFKAMSFHKFHYSLGSLAWPKPGVRLRGYLHETGMNSHRYELVPTWKFFL